MDLVEQHADPSAQHGPGPAMVDECPAQATAGFVDGKPDSSGAHGVDGLCCGKVDAHAGPAAAAGATIQPVAASAIGASSRHTDKAEADAVLMQQPAAEQHLQSADVPADASHAADIAPDPGPLDPLGHPRPGDNCPGAAADIAGFSSTLPAAQSKCDGPSEAVAASDIPAVVAAVLDGPVSLDSSREQAVALEASIPPLGGETADFSLGLYVSRASAVGSAEGDGASVAVTDCAPADAGISLLTPATEAVASTDAGAALDPSEQLLNGAASPPQAHVAAVTEITSASARRGRSAKSEALPEPLAITATGTYTAALVSAKPAPQARSHGAKRKTTAATNLKTKTPALGKDDEAGKELATAAEEGSAVAHVEPVPAVGAGKCVDRRRLSKAGAKKQKDAASLSTGNAPADASAVDTAASTAMQIDGPADAAAAVDGFVDEVQLKKSTTDAAGNASNQPEGIVVPGPCVTVNGALTLGKPSTADLSAEIAEGTAAAAGTPTAAAAARKPKLSKSAAAKLGRANMLKRKAEAAAAVSQPPHAEQSSSEQGQGPPGTTPPPASQAAEAPELAATQPTGAAPNSSETAAFKSSLPNGQPSAAPPADAPPNLSASDSPQEGRPVRARQRSVHAPPAPESKAPAAVTAKRKSATTAIANGHAVVSEATVPADAASSRKRGRSTIAVSGVTAGAPSGADEVVDDADAVAGGDEAEEPPMKRARPSRARSYAVAAAEELSVVEVPASTSAPADVVPVTEQVVAALPTAAVCAVPQDAANPAVLANVDPAVDSKAVAKGADADCGLPSAVDADVLMTSSTAVDTDAPPQPTPASQPANVEVRNSSPSLPAPKSPTAPQLPSSVRHTPRSAPAPLRTTSPHSPAEFPAAANTGSLPVLSPRKASSSRNGSTAVLPHAHEGQSLGDAMADELAQMLTGLSKTVNTKNVLTTYRLTGFRIVYRKNIASKPVILGRGIIDSDGMIRCSCNNCKEQSRGLSMTEFELHLGSMLKKPAECITIEELGLTFQDLNRRIGDRLATLHGLPKPKVPGALMRAEKAQKEMEMAVRRGVPLPPPEAELDFAARPSAAPQLARRTPRALTAPAMSAYPSRAKLSPQKPPVCCFCHTLVVLGVEPSSNDLTQVSSVVGVAASVAAEGAAYADSALPMFPAHIPGSAVTPAVTGLEADAAANADHAAVPAAVSAAHAVSDVVPATAASEPGVVKTEQGTEGNEATASALKPGPVGTGSAAFAPVKDEHTLEQAQDAKHSTEPMLAAAADEAPAAPVEPIADVHLVTVGDRVTLEAAADPAVAEALAPLPTAPEVTIEAPSAPTCMSPALAEKEVPTSLVPAVEAAVQPSALPAAKPPPEVMATDLPTAAAASLTGSPAVADAPSGRAAAATESQAAPQAVDAAAQQPACPAAGDAGGLATTLSELESSAAAIAGDMLKRLVSACVNSVAAATSSHIAPAAPAVAQPEDAKHTADVSLFPADMHTASTVDPATATVPPSTSTAGPSSSHSHGQCSMPDTSLQVPQLQASVPGAVVAGNAESLPISPPPLDLSTAHQPSAAVQAPSPASHAQPACAAVSTNSPPAAVAGLHNMHNNVKASPVAFPAIPAALWSSLLSSHAALQPLSAANLQQLLAASGSPHPQPQPVAGHRSSSPPQHPSAAVNLADLAQQRDTAAMISSLVSLLLPKAASPSAAMADPATATALPPAVAQAGASAGNPSAAAMVLLTPQLHPSFMPAASAPSAQPDNLTANTADGAAVVAVADPPSKPRPLHSALLAAAAALSASGRGSSPNPPYDPQPRSTPPPQFNFQQLAISLQAGHKLSSALAPQLASQPASLLQSQPASAPPAPLNSTPLLYSNGVNTAAPLPTDSGAPLTGIVACQSCATLCHAACLQKAGHANPSVPWVCQACVLKQAGLPPSGNRKRRATTFGALPDKSEKAKKRRHKSSAYSEDEEMVVAGDGLAANRERRNKSTGTMHYVDDSGTDMDAYGGGYADPGDNSGRVSMACPTAHKPSAARMFQRQRNKHRRLFDGEAAGLQHGDKVVYMFQGKKLLEGSISLDPNGISGILCGHCDTVISCSGFEAHAGHKQRRNPYDGITTMDGLTLRQIAARLPALPQVPLGAPLEGAAAAAEVAAMKSNYGGGRMARETSKAKAASTQPAEEEAPADLSLASSCVLCHAHDFCKDGFSARTVMICDQCEKEYHVGCLREHGLADLQAVPVGDWFCSPGCRTIKQMLAAQLLKGDVALDAVGANGGGYSLQWLKGKNSNKGTGKALSTVLEILQGSFDPIMDATTGQDLLPKMVQATAQGDWDFTTMHTLLLKHRGRAVCAGILRVFGPQLAELPLVATRNDARRMGHCRVLMDSVEATLKSLGVKVLALPAASSAVPTWRNGFAFKDLPPASLQVAKTELRMLIFPGTTVLAKVLIPNPNGDAEPLQPQIVPADVASPAKTGPNFEDGAAGAPDEQRCAADISDLEGKDSGTAVLEAAAVKAEQTGAELHGLHPDDTSVMDIPSTDVVAANPAAHAVTGAAPANVDDLEDVPLSKLAASLKGVAVSGDECNMMQVDEASAAAHATVQATAPTVDDSASTLSAKAVQQGSRVASHPVGNGLSSAHGSESGAASGPDQMDVDGPDGTDHANSQPDKVNRARAKGSARGKGSRLSKAKAAQGAKGAAASADLLPGSDQTVVK